MRTRFQGNDFRSPRGCSIRPNLTLAALIGIAGNRQFRNNSNGLPQLGGVRDDFRRYNPDFNSPVRNNSILTIR